MTIPDPNASPNTTAQTNPAPIDVDAITQQILQNVLAVVHAPNTYRPHTPLIPSALAGESEEFFLGDKRFKPDAPKRWDGSDLSTYYGFKRKACDYVLACLPHVEATGVKGSRLAASLLDGAAWDWYCSVTPPAEPYPFHNYEKLFHELATDFGVFQQEDNARTQLYALTSKPWTGDFHSYFTTFRSIVTWIHGMDARTKRDDFLRPLSKEVKTFAAAYTFSTWEEAHRIISGWLTQQNLWNYKPAAYYHPPAHPTSGAMPMEIGAVTAPATRPAGSSSTKMSPKDFWKDKQCMACGQLGHGKNYKGCPKHPQYNPIHKTARSAAVVSAAVSSTSGAGPSTSGAGPSSYADAVSAAVASTREADLQTQLTEMKEEMAIFRAALKD